jgi:Domain of unknown function (DUF4280)
MPNLVVAGAMLECSFGAAPCALIVLPVNKVLCGTPAANINDHIPITNIPTFGMCSSLGNPEVQTATTAADGVLTPMPCVPATTAPWAPGATTVLLGNVPALDNISKCLCTMGGAITITEPGEETVEIP